MLEDREIDYNVLDALLAEAMCAYLEDKLEDCVEGLDQALILVRNRLKESKNEL